MTGNYSIFMIYVILLLSNQAFLNLGKWTSSNEVNWLLATPKSYKF